MLPTLIQTFELQGQPAVVLGTNLSDYLAKDLHEALDLSKRNVVIISDSHVGPIYSPTLLQAFQPYSRSVVSFIVDSGETSKSIATKTKIETFLLTQKCNRDSILIALGGGMVTDIVGFVAATYMRGIQYVNVPTSLLAMVDASIGGKTAINHEFGKNLIGSFHLPFKVYIDLNYLTTLSERHVQNGLAEMIKAAVISDFQVFQKYFYRLDPIHHLDTLIPLIQHAIQLKLNVVSKDLKESNVRAFLNYGHTIGHAIEWDTPDTLLHGECVAIGMVMEAKLAHWMGMLSLQECHWIEQVCSIQGLPTQLPLNLMNRDSLLVRMTLDKKNTQDIRIVLLHSIGHPVLLPVPIAKLQWLFSPAAYLSPIVPTPPSNNELTIDVPGSKSMTNRALLLAALGKGTVTLTRVLYSLDTRVMLHALQTVGLCQVEYTLDGLKITGHGGQFQFQQTPCRVDLENAGTAVRFLTACFTLSPSPIELDGDARMKLRPIEPLVDALNQNGCKIKSLSTPGYIPLRIEPGKMKGGKIKLDAELSSQYVSAILMCAPYAETPVELELLGEKVVSETYIQMTIAMMRTFGINVVQHSKYRYSIPLGVYTNPSSYAIEPDASSATYPLALAAISPGLTVVVPGLGISSLQGDAKFCKHVLQPMGCEVEQTQTFTKVKGPTTLKALGEVDMSNLTDAFLTLAVVASLANGETIIHGIENQRIKECNRIHAVVMELQRLGVQAKERSDGLQIIGPTSDFLFHEVLCHNDHRIAMAFSLFSLKTSLVIRDKDCVEKTWPHYFETFISHGLVRFSSYTLLPSRTSIILIGMRGMGKSSLGKQASKELNMYFIDLDEVFENIHGPILKFVDVHGWSTFRQKETAIFKSMVFQYRKNCIIATGGGLIETQEAVDLLGKCGSHVVHVRRGWLPEPPISCELKKPIFDATDFEIFQRRLPKYETAAFEFVIPERQLGKKNDYDWEKIQLSFARFLQRLDEFRTLLVPPHSDTSVMTAGYVSLSCSQIETILTQLETISQGVKALELRLDLLEVPSFDQDLLMHPLLHTYSHALFTLRQFTPLPIILSLRTEAQGGKFPLSQGADFVHLILSKCIQWGVEAMDVEISFDSDLPKLLELKQLALKNKVNLMPSFHDPLGKLPWTSKDWTELVCIGKQVNPNFIKLVSYAHSPKANFELISFRESHAYIPQLLQINMGPRGRLSRLLSSWTPVTHPLLPPAAPGQLTLKELYQLQAQTLMQPRCFYLFGEPIHASPSPLMHSAAFEFYGLNFAYTYTPCEGPTSVLPIQLSQPDFGGASVTIPHKHSILNYVNEVDKEVQLIGAANTVYVHQGQLKAANTDWLAMSLILNQFHFRLNCVCVLGAGGTARAALYALSQLRPSPRQVLLCNRTKSKAELLLRDFQNLFTASDLNSMSLDIPSIQSIQPNVLINTLPNHAQPLFEDGLPNTHVIELAYQTNGMPLFKGGPVKSIRCGWELLLEQGIAQFKLWTGLDPPRTVMEKAIKSCFS